MMLPTSLFDFTQEANDFYFPPLDGHLPPHPAGERSSCSPCFITPVWYLMVSEPERLPDWLDFLSSPEPASLQLSCAQLLVVEFLMDVLKLASLNTPDSLSNSFSMLGALILGDFAVQAGWLGPEVLVYMAFVSVAGFAQPSYELGYAFKLLRVAAAAADGGLRPLGLRTGAPRYRDPACHLQAHRRGELPLPPRPLRRQSHAPPHFPGTHLQGQYVKKAPAQDQTPGRRLVWGK